VYHDLGCRFTQNLSDYTALPALVAEYMDNPTATGHECWDSTVHSGFIATISCEGEEYSKYIH